MAGEMLPFAALPVGQAQGAGRAVPWDRVRQPGNGLIVRVPSNIAYNVFHVRQLNDGVAWRDQPLLLQNSNNNPSCPAFRATAALHLSLLQVPSRFSRQTFRLASVRQGISPAVPAHR